MEKRDYFESQIDIRSRLDEQLKGRALEKLAAGIGAAGVHGTGSDRDGEYADRAVALCLKYYGYTAGKVPTGWRICWSICAVRARSCTGACP